MPSRRAMEDRTDSTLSRSPSISLVFTTSSVRAARQDRFRRSKPIARSNSAQETPLGAADRVSADRPGPPSRSASETSLREFSKHNHRVSCGDYGGYSPHGQPLLQRTVTGISAELTAAQAPNQSARAQSRETPEVAWDVRTSRGGAGRSAGPKAAGYCRTLLAQCKAANGAASTECAGAWAATE